MSDYQMTIHTRKGVIGHFTIEITGPDGQRVVRGFEPKTDKDSVASATLSNVKGEVKNDLDKLNDPNIDYMSSKSIPDATGRINMPQPVRAIPKTPAPPRAPCAGSPACPNRCGW